MFLNGILHLMINMSVLANSTGKFPKIGRSVKLYEFLVTFMKHMKYTVHDIINADEPNIKITVRQFYKLQNFLSQLDLT